MVHPERRQADVVQDEHYHACAPCLHWRTPYVCNCAPKCAAMTPPPCMQDSHPRGVIEVRPSPAHAALTAELSFELSSKRAHNARQAPWSPWRLSSACPCQNPCNPPVAVQVSSCLAIKGAEDSQECRGKPHAFEISTQGSGPQFFVADSCQVRAPLPQSQRRSPPA